MTDTPQKLLMFNPEIGPPQLRDCLGSTVRVYSGRGAPWFDAADIRRTLEQHGALQDDTEPKAEFCSSALCWERGQWFVRSVLRDDGVIAITNKELRPRFQHWLHATNKAVRAAASAASVTP